jgi:hypothetical protein
MAAFQDQIAHTGFLLVSANAGDTLQLYVNANVAGPFDFTIRMALVQSYAP